MKRKFNYYRNIQVELLDDIEFLDGKMRLRHGNEFTNDDIKIYQKLVLN